MTWKRTLDGLGNRRILDSEAKGMIVLDTSVLIDLFRGSEIARSYLTSDSVTSGHEILAGIKHRKAKSECEALSKVLFRCPAPGDESRCCKERC